MNLDRSSKNASPQHRGKNFQKIKAFFSNPLNFSIFFAVVGIFWIIGTDILVEYFIPTPKNIIVLEIGKGIQLILVIIGLVYWLTSRVVNNVESRDSNQELEQRRQSFEDIAGRMIQGFQVIGFDWTYIYLNDAALQQTRKNLEELIGRKVMHVFPELINTNFFSILQNCMETRTSQLLENIFEYPSSPPGEFYLHVFPVPEGIGIISVDCREINHLREVFQTSEEHNRAILASLGEAVLLIDQQPDKIIYCNPAVESIFGYTPDELVGQSSEILHIDHAHYQQISFTGKPILDEKGVFIAEFPRKRKDGIIIETGNVITVLDKGPGWQEGVVLVVRDITLEKQSKAALLDSEERFRTLVAATSQIIWVNNANREMKDVSPSWKAFTGQSSDEIMGDDWIAMVHPDDRDKALSAWHAALESGTAYESEYRLRRYDGIYRYFHVRGVPRFLPDGSVREWIGSYQDITERKNSEMQLKRMVERLNSLRNIDQLITALAPVELSYIQIIQEALRTLNIDAAALLLSQSSYKLKTVASQGFIYPESTLIELRSDEGVAGRSALKRECFVSTDIQKEEVFTRREMAAREGFHGYVVIPMVVKGEMVGILEVFRREIGELPLDQVEFLNSLTCQASIAVSTLYTFQDLQISNERLFLAYDANIEGWSRALDYRDKETEGHSRRVTEITITLAEMMGISDDQLRYIRWGALLHDIGKMGIPDKILRKPGKLTDEEWAVMKSHPTIARDLLSPILFLEPSLDIPYCHHEKWDGSGYPRGLKGEDIPLAARIFSVADVWDALRSDRPYRNAWSEEKVIEYLKEISGTHLDPAIVEKFLRYWQDIPACNSLNYE